MNIPFIKSTGRMINKSHSAGFLYELFIEGIVIWYGEIYTKLENGGSSMITIKEIAEMAGVSTTTVWNVIHGKTKKVSPQNVERIQKILEEQKYVTPMGLRALKNGKSNMIGVVLHVTKHFDLSLVSDPFYSRLIGELERVLNAAGHYMLLYSSKSIESIFQMAMAWNVEGLICLNFSENDYQKLSILVDIPIVSVDLFNIGNSNHKYYNVGLQDEEGGYLMTKYLISQGFREILILAIRDLGIEHERILGYRRALEEAGIKFKDKYFIKIYSDAVNRQKNYQDLCKFMKRGMALFFLADLYAVEAMAYFQKRGYKIPEDISVAGFDNLSYAHLCTPGLTTVNQDIEQKARKAAEMLLKLIQKEPIKEHNVLLPVNLVIRESVGQNRKP